MASKDTLAVFGPFNNEPPSSGYATIDIRNVHPVLDFDPALDECAIFTSVLPRTYQNGGITVNIWFALSSGVNKQVVWKTEFERMDTSGIVVDNDSFGTAIITSGNAPPTSGTLTMIPVAHTSGAQLDSVTGGETFRLKLWRLGTNGNDTQNGSDAEVYAVELLET